MTEDSSATQDAAMTPVALSLSLIRYAQRSLEEFRKTAGSRARMSFTMNNGAAHSGTDILEIDGAWVIRSGSTDTVINPLAVSSFKLID
ncbi:hypothetical protein [Sphingosinicella rhizophila]|uniref:Uncharacterized protein n=1 Tax=Sphingosinicella rhizophila TaxID=3050082 RepID=A0ABU3QBF9_9SPHN|nr:hypothetical protein [Sphingosinicella sp. GR2756]MDT9600657.1 hypothetical protein [Sphingosinicella sp. GR2756]